MPPRDGQIGTISVSDSAELANRDHFSSEKAIHLAQMKLKNPPRSFGTLVAVSAGISLFADRILLGDGDPNTCERKLRSIKLIKRSS